MTLTKQQKFNNIYNQIAAFQKIHLNEHGKYWQGVEVPAEIPTEGDNPAIDKTVKPTDQTESWQDKNVTFPTPCDIQFRVDTWKNNGNQGWNLIARYKTTLGQAKEKIKDELGNETDWLNVDLSTEI